MKIGKSANNEIKANVLEVEKIPGIEYVGHTLISFTDQVQFEKNEAEIRTTESISYNPKHKPLLNLKT